MIDCEYRRIGGLHNCTPLSPGVNTPYLVSRLIISRQILHSSTRLAGLGIAVAKKADTRFPMKGFMAADTGGFLRIRITSIRYASHILLQSPDRKFRFRVRLMNGGDNSA